MDIKLLLLFCLFNIINVIMQTVKSIVTIKGKKLVAALVNAIAYGFYAVVIVYTVSDLPLLLKAFIVGLANLIGVYVVKYIEEKSYKDKLWKVEASIKDLAAYEEIISHNIPCNYLNAGPKYYLLYCFCRTKDESRLVKSILDKYGSKYFASESKIL